MPWPLLTLLALATLVGLHIWWRARWLKTMNEAARNLAQAREEEKRTRQQLQAQQEATFNGMVEGLLILDTNGRIEHANRAFFRLLGFEGDVKGKTLMEALRLHQLDSLLDKLARDRISVGLEVRLPGPPERTLEVNAAAILAADASHLGSILVFHDTTRVKQLERTREEFVANVSHELRTPLSLIKGYTETLLDGATANPEVSGKFLAIINRNAVRLEFLINDLLTISELESGRSRINLAPAALDGILEKAIADHQVFARTKRVELRREPSGLQVAADVPRIEQVVGNLLDNAIKYGRQEGRVTVSARSLGDGFAEVAVQDDGPGIPQDSLERVFERFYRVDKARSRDQGGTGLGLSIVKHIVQGHGGKAWVTSRMGEGATFFFTLPTAPP